MHLKRTATYVVVGAALAAWLAAAATSGTRSASDPPVLMPSADPDVAALANQVSRLRERLIPGAVPVRPGRDLFRFEPAKQKTTVAASKPAALVEASAAPESLVPVRPPLKLDGIAEDAQPAGIVRTAIISAAGQLFLAREGDTVTTRFKVSRIGADAVELVDLLTDQTFRLPLR